MGTRADNEGAGKKKGRGGVKIRSRPPEPWERQEGEAQNSFQCFVAYRDLPNRTIAEVAKTLGVREGTIHEMCQRWLWVERAAAWDNELDRRIQEAEASELAKMRKRQIQVGIGLQIAAGKELNVLIKKVEKADREAEALGISARENILQPREIVKLAEAGAKLERVNRGEPDTIIGVQSPGENRLDALTLDEKRVMLALVEKMSGT